VELCKRIWFATSACSRNSDLRTETRGGRLLSVAVTSQHITLTRTQPDNELLERSSATRRVRLAIASGTARSKALKERSSTWSAVSPTRAAGSAPEKALRWRWRPASTGRRWHRGPRRKGTPAALPCRCRARRRPSGVGLASRRRCAARGWRSGVAPRGTRRRRGARELAADGGRELVGSGKGEKERRAGLGI
jgi:hypothetical protein